eukprot:5703065-Pleurochrysis_carterae.AAC.1
MLSPIRETGERAEPSSAEMRGTRSTGKQSLSMAEGSAPDAAGRQESDFVERREKRSAEKRVPRLLEEHKQDSTDTPESSLPEGILSASTARIT